MRISYARHGGKISVVNQQAMSQQQELVEDLMAHVHCFSSRLYGLRKYKSEIEEKISDIELETSKTYQKLLGY